MDSGSFPMASFTFTNPVALVRPAPGQPQSFTATGELMLHGVTKTVTVTLDTVLTGHGGQVTVHPDNVQRLWCAGTQHRICHRRGHRFRRIYSESDTEVND